jgi:hypothetical protein
MVNASGISATVQTQYTWTKNIGGGESNPRLALQDHDLRVIVTKL